MTSLAKQPPSSHIHAMPKTSYSYPKTLRLTKRGEISRVLADGRASRGKFVVAKLKPNDLGHPRLGVVVSRKYGNAPMRNHMKRRMREVFRLNQAILGSFDIVMLPRAGKNPPPYADFEEDMLLQIEAAKAKWNSEEQA